jgi:hypothetical protein
MYKGRLFEEESVRGEGKREGDLVENTIEVLCMHV